MGFTSRISRVQVFVVWKSSCRLKVGCRRCIYAIRSHRWSVIIGFTYILDTGFYVQYHLLLLLSRNPPLSNFRIVSEQGRTKDLKTQNWQLYKSPERASAVSTNIWGDQPSRRSGSGFIVFGSEAWVPVTSLCVWKSISCLLSLIPKICLSFLLLLLSSALGESWVVWVDSAWHCMSPHLQRWKMLELVSQNYWWPGLSRYVAKFIAGCDECNWTKTFPTQKVGKLIPNKTPARCWQVTSIDMIGE